ncbi:MAG: aldehyde dehydrogenase family protein, partial [Verrucomicrobiota bacterium]
GQRCVCARRLILPRDAFGDAVLDRLIEVSSNLRIGPPNLDPEPFYGPVISTKAASGVLQARDHLLTLGAETLLNMTRESDDSTLLSPGILDVTALAELPDQEIFGPLLQVIRVPDFETAITEANQTAYGLSSGLLCEEQDRWENYFRHARAGIVNWNRPITGASGAQPFGGIGHSGNHRPSGYFAIDYCAFPVASTFGPSLDLPESLAPGIQL